LASLYNSHVLDHTPLQDTNDRFLANIQRGGTYSVVPRVPAGEITPDKLVAIGEIAKEYGLYTKITGGQRIDMFGAKKQDLPDIWEKLVDQGFETGQAYGKSIRTVKSCVGSTWCRYGIGDSVGFAVRIENRYKGLRSPHKLKGGVSGCVRECAEAQSKDFGLIATDKGYNLFVCGNGGAKPKHAVLLAGDVPEELCIRYLDRFLMYYISTADKLTRTARWLEKMEGGIDHLRRVIIDDHLKIAAELETQMEYLVSTYQCEWATVVRDPERRLRFRQFVNSEENQDEIEFIPERGQRRPANWPKDTLPTPPRSPTSSSLSLDDRTWVPIGPAHIFPKDCGETFKYGECQLAIFHTSTDEWYASQNMCPHKRAFVLSQGLLGDSGDGTPYVSCGMHKKNFSLSNGKCLVPGEEEKYSLMTFEVKVGDDGLVHALLPSEEALNAVLSTKKLMVTRRSTDNDQVDDDVEIVSSNCGSSGCGDKKLEW
jgi:nitrite reductase (NAD(P)H)